MGNQFIDFAYVKEHADFAAVLAHYNIETTGSGDEKRALCPFHEERKPSFVVNLEKKVFHCFGCEAKGNVLEFVVYMEKSELREAAIVLGEICGIKMSARPARSFDKRQNEEKPRSKASRKPVQGGKGGRRGRSTPETGDATSGKPRPSKRQAPSGETEAAENEELTFTLKLDPDDPYGEARDLSPSIVEHFEMGGCGRGLMKNRWCIPIHDGDGTLVAYAGRWADEDVPENEAKWLLPPKFRKSDVLFNLHRLLETEHVVVVEGFFDAIRLHELDVPVVSVMGTSISDEQVALLVDAGTRYVTVMFDGDDAGQEACEKVVGRLARRLFVRSARLSDGEDPSSAEEDELIELVGELAVAA